MGAQWAPHPNFGFCPYFFSQKVQWVQQIVNKYKNKRKIKEINGQIAHDFFFLNNGR